MIAPHLLRHTVRVWKPASTSTPDAYGNPGGDLVKEPKTRRAFVQVDGRTEAPTGEGADTVLADFSVFLDHVEGDALDERCEIEWGTYAGTSRLRVVGVRHEQGPGYTHHVRVLARVAR